MKNVLFVTGLLLAASLQAHAEATPQQIESTLASGHYSEARIMTQEVLRAHPNSARAHLFEAYVLIHVDHDRAGASRELSLVESLDTVGKVKNTPLFGRTVAEVEAVPAVQTPVIHAHAAQIIPPMPVASPPHESHWFLWTVVLVLLFLVIRYLWNSRNAWTPNDPVYHGNSVGPAPSGYYPGTRYSTTQTNPGYSGGMVTQPVYHSGMGALGTAAAVAGGVVAGELLADELMNRNHHLGSGSSSSDQSWDTAPSSTEPAPSYRRA